MPKSLILSAIVVSLSIGFYFTANAANVSLQGYVYSDSAGWISLSCSDTDSCSSISYGVSEDANGDLSGYGYSQNGEWINFNPNYGGANIDSAGNMSGWIFAQDIGWINTGSSKIFSAQELETKAESAKNIINSYDTANLENLSNADAASLLNSLCNLLGNNQCANINN